MRDHPSQEALFLSVIAPAYNEESGIAGFVRAVYEELERLPELKGRACEIVIVDDGSSDRTVERVLALAAAGLPVELVQLSRNFGHQVALSAGIDAARGEVLITMDADLQHPPQYFGDMLHAWSSGADVVLMKKRSSHRREPYKTLLARGFYALMRRISDTPTEPDVGDFRLISREVADVVRACKETHRFLRGLVAWAGFRQVVLEYEVAPRASGVSKYTLRRLWRLASTGLFSHSSVPLMWPFALGVPLFCGALLYLLFGLVSRIVAPESTPRGWLSAFGFLFLFSGLTFVALGIQGAYIAKIFEQCKQRPTYIVRRRQRALPDHACDAEQVHEPDAASHALPGGRLPLPRPRTPIKPDEREDLLAADAGWNEH